MKEQQSSYRQIFKATSIFGGVQVFNIVISIIRSKIIAVLLGTNGMGIIGLLSSTTGLLSSITNFGLGTSAVKDLALVNESGNAQRISDKIAIFQKLIWISGALGSVTTFFFAPFLSQLTFGNNDYSLAFKWISITLLLNQITNKHIAILQAFRRIHNLAKANMAGSFIGLIVSIPLYYFFGTKGIIPSIILSSIFALMVAGIYTEELNYSKEKVSTSYSLKNGISMIKLGFFLSLSSLITVGSSYIIRIYVRDAGGVSEVGLYNAGAAIITTYVGLVFTAMSTDYFPRLSAVSEDNIKASILINQQAEIAILILAPILSVFLIFINLLIIGLYSSAFTAINDMILWAALGMYFKAVSWSIGFILLAKGETKIFFLSELASNIYQLIFNYLGYKFYGLSGLGMSFLLVYILVLFQVYFIANIKYKFFFNKDVFKIFVIQFSIGLLCFILIKITILPWAYLIGTPLIILSCIYSYRKIDERIGINQILDRIFQRKISHFE